MRIGKIVRLLLLTLVAMLLVVNIASADEFDPYAPFVRLSSTSVALLVNGKTDYNPDAMYEPLVPSLSFPKPYTPKFLWLYVDPINFNEYTEGTMLVAPSQQVVLEYYSNGLVSIWNFIGEKLFNVWYSDAHYLGDENGAEAEFKGDAETAFLNTPFSATIGDISINGVFPARLRTTTEQMETVRCAPYIELVAKEDGKTLKEVKLRFVNPSNPVTALLRDDNANVNVVTQVAIRTISDKSVVRNQNMVRFVNGDALEGVFDFSSMNLLMDNIEWVRPYFRYGDSTGIRSDVTHSWRFYTSKGEEPAPVDPTQPTPDKPNDEDIAIAETAANSNLIEPPTEIKAAEQTNIKTGTEVKFAGDEVKSRTSSVISVSQNVAEGGAVVLGTSMTLPINSQSLSGANLPIPADFSDLTGKYQVLKYFENGGSVDLLWAFGSKIFSYSPTTGVIMTATIVVIDGPVPDSEKGNVFSPSFGGDKYGVKLSTDYKYLYVYDGIKDGVAKDPIALVQGQDDDGNDGDDDNNNGGGSSSGCNTGFIAILGLVAVPLVLRKK